MYVKLHDTGAPCNRMDPLRRREGTPPWSRTERCDSLRQMRILELYMAEAAQNGRLAPAAF